MASKSAMPELPGMWYDARRNRYFRIANDNRGPRKRSSSRIEPPNTTKRARVPSVLQVLRHTEEGREEKIPLIMPMTLLVNSKPIPVQPRERIRHPGYCYMPDSIPVLQGHQKVVLCTFPKFEVDHSFTNNQGIDEMHWAYPPGMVAVTSSTIYGNDIRHVVTVSPLGIAREDRQLSNIPTSYARFPSIELSHAVTIENQSGNTFVAGDTRTQRFSHVPLAAFPHSDNSAGLSVVAMPNKVFTGTRAGHVHMWDLRRRPHRPMHSFRPSKKHSAVTDMKIGADGISLYVSCMRNKINNLAKWDLRMPSSEPAVVFRGHRNSHKKLKFDIVETNSGGILLAGGDDSVIRVWNTSVGGTGVECANIPGEIPKYVRLVGWNSVSPSPPGAFIVTNVRKYVMVSGRR